LSVSSPAASVLPVLLVPLPLLLLIVLLLLLTLVACGRRTV
jgi:hypothetical protein